MELQKLIDRLENLLEPILEDSGSIVFSSVDTISKGDVYTLGLNPGGGTIIPIKKILLDLPSKKHNSYIDESWGNNKNSSYDAGSHPLQKNYIGFLKALGLDPKIVFSTNLIFSRSRGQYGSGYPNKANICWKAHQEFIKLVDPKYFLVFGNSKISPYQYIKKRYSLEDNGHIDSGHGNWKCHSCYGKIEGKERHLIGVPHLSRYYITYHPEVINWISSNLIDIK